MSDDAPQPPSSFYTWPSRSLARVSQVVDDNIRVVQYGIYCGAAAGVLLVLHSVRAFTKFAHIDHIPEEFIRKHVRLHGRVRSVDVSPPAAAPTLALPQPDAGAAPRTSPVHTENVSISPAPGNDAPNMRENVDVRGARGYYPGRQEGAQETVRREDCAHTDGTSEHSEQHLRPLFLQVEHRPVIALWRNKGDHLLPLQLAAVQATTEGVRRAQEQLTEQRVWFTLLGRDAHTITALVKQHKVLGRTVNEELVREGVAVPGPLDLALQEDPQYLALYARLLRAEALAQKRGLGMWRPSGEPHKGRLATMFGKLRAFVWRLRQ
ncbi:protein C3orf33 isoform X1 [Procambarus clarkii]|uniref:protein C3orf33 isoform X1 n=1 Tax=Procambarus clarkii TaxID=6728 RepID=UPI003743CFF3